MKGILIKIILRIMRLLGLEAIAVLKFLELKKDG